MKILFALLLTGPWAVAETIPVVLAPRATQAERTAAAELVQHLAKTWPSDRFEIARAPKAGRAILLGTPSTFPELAKLAGRDRLTRPESFLVGSNARNGFIAGADPAGVVFGVYALLEKLGWGFYLSYDAAPAPPKGAFSFEGWNLSDAPVFRDRVVFDWHNFLSSASTWEFEDWQRWIQGAARMRYNTVMVHAYGNNPMFSFQFNGQQKPAGYLSTTAKGRDWGTQHVNDVRRFSGGGIFRSPVFGSSVALAPEDERVPAAQASVRRAFEFARGYGLHVTFAVDVDTESANPQNVILTLPETARFRSGKLQLPNPDTPEGYAYWKAQVAQLLETYPQVDRLVVWFRANATPWRAVKPEEFPAEWKTRYEAALERNAAMRTNKDAPSMFAIGRITAAFARALADIGRKDVELGCGTWHSGHLPAADAFFEPQVKLYWLDWTTTFDKPEIQQALRSIRHERQMLPVVWAHHDDRTYIGRSYTPFPKFTSLVEGTGTGFGIIHWTTRPLDLYFKSLSEQVWQSTRDRDLAATTRDMAAHSFGPAAAEIGGEYLLRWVKEGRMFGRETSNRFIDQPLADAADVIAKCRDRIALLAKIDEGALPPDGRERVRYYRDYEEFTAAFFRSHSAFERAQDLHKRGRTEEARAAMREADPGAVIEQYVKAASRGRMTRGEQALIVSLNLRWLPYLVSMRQALGLDPARYKFEPTQHEPLAQGAGSNTFWIDSNRAMWKGLGEKETGAPAYSEPRGDEICRSGIRIAQPFTMKLTGIMGDAFAPGRYRVSLTSAQPANAAIEIRSGGASAQGNGALLEIPGGAIELTVRPAAGPVLACGVVVTPEGK